VTTHQVIPAEPGDAATLATVIAEAFHELPPSRWLISDPRARADVFPRYFRIFVEATMIRGTAYTTPDRAAVALWFPIGPNGPAPPTDDYDAVLAQVTGPWAERFAAFDAKLDRHHPTGIVHEHLAMLAVRPSVQGQGIGTALLCAHHRVLDEVGLPGYLEASALRSKALYERHGYADHGLPVRLPDGPVLWPMWRPHYIGSRVPEAEYPEPARQGKTWQARPRNQRAASGRSSVRVIAGEVV
jgi:GNAT superfamily N-acetyltransferase